MKVVATNKKAHTDYEIIEKIEAGLSLLGTEVKSLREGRINLKDAYCKFKNGELYLVNAHISPYKHSKYVNHDPERPRKLLLRKRELKRLLGKVSERGFTIIPLKVYFNEKGIAKVEVALAKGRRSYDKREKIAQRDLERRLRREEKYYN